MNAKAGLEDLKQRFPNEPEYHQAVEEVLGTIEEEYNKHPEFDKVNLIERLCIPDRVYTFRVKYKMLTGDLNSNGVLDIDDVTVLQRYLAEFVELTDEQLKAADMNSDGSVDINDATEIQRKLAAN